MFKLPNVPTANGLINKAFHAGAEEAKKKKSVLTKISRDVRDKLSEERKLEIIADIIIGDLKAIIKYFPVYEDLPLFYQDLLDVKINKNKYKKSLGAVNWCRQNIEKLRNKTLNQIHHTGKEDKTKISNLSNEFMGRCASFIKKISSDLDLLIEIKEILLDFPDITPQPTIVIAGFPNVGKSTFMRTLTGSKVKIAPYPFTTTEIYLGHIKVKYLLYRIIDTPGLLDRPMKDRNMIELQAILAIKHLADVLFFIIDPTKTDQNEISQQLNLLYEIKKNFPFIPVITAINKTDMIKDKEEINKIKKELSGFNIVEMIASDYESSLNAFNEAQKLFTNIDKYL